MTTAKTTFDMVVAAYQEATGQSTAKAKEDVSNALAQAWAATAFGDGLSRRVASETAKGKEDVEA